MKTYSKYINNEDHNWYDSSNIIYSVCFDDQKNGNKSLKIIFKGGRTYLYRDVTPIEYTQFRDAQSQGKVFNEFIKNHECVKLDDTSLDDLERMRLKFIEMGDVIDLNLTINMNDDTGEFQLYKDGIKIFESIEGEVAILNLFKAIGLSYNYNIVGVKNQTTEEFETKNIIN